MATEKKIKGVIIPRHDTAKNWAKAVNFVPANGELIIYSKDSTEDLARGYYLDEQGRPLNLVTIGDKTYPVQPSDIVRFKFGNGTDNVNVLPFATTEVDLTDYATEDWVRAYIAENGGTGGGGLTEDDVIELIKENADAEAAIVYLNTQEHIGRTLELQDVYPIQAEDTKLQIISKNRLKYKSGTNKSGLTIAINPDTGVKVTGQATQSISADTLVGTVDITTPGKYTLSVDNSGVETSTNHCYLTYSLYDANNTCITLPTALFAAKPVIIDTKELNCSKIEIELRIACSSGTTFNTSAAQTFKPQVEYGDVATAYTAPKTESNIGNKTINIYGRNLYSGSSINGSGNFITINDIDVPNATTAGIHYVKGVMTENNVITITTGSETRSINVPLLIGDKFTFIYTYSTMSTLRNIQILHGHTDYAEYEPYEIDETVSDSNGICDISTIKYPYSFLALEDTAANEGYTIYLRYDPALSRNWTEAQLNAIDKRLDAIEDGNIDVNLDDYATIEYVQTELDKVDNQIIVSETEPEVSEETIWLQPMITDTGAVDYIVEQGIQNSAYYEKWNSGIVKYYLSETVSVQANYVDDKQVLSIPVSTCKNVITHNINVHGNLSKSIVAYNTAYNIAGENLNITLTIDNQTSATSVTLHHTIIGFWK